MEANTPTPRTDKEAFWTDNFGSVVPVPFAATLERELAAARADRDAIAKELLRTKSWRQSAHDHAMNSIRKDIELAELRAEVERLNQWKHEALTIQQWWQDVDSAVRARPDSLGRDVSKTALRFIEERDELRAEREDILSALGEHGESPVNIAQRICEIRDEGRAHFHSVAQLTAALEAYRAKRAVDGMNGRTWDALGHYDAEGRINAIEAALGREGA